MICPVCKEESNPRIDWIGIENHTDYYHLKWLKTHLIKEIKKGNYKAEQRFADCIDNISVDYDTVCIDMLKEVSIMNIDIESCIKAICLIFKLPRIEVVIYLNYLINKHLKNVLKRI